MCDTCGCKGAETFDAEREIHQLIIFDGSRADTLVFETIFMKGFMGLKIFQTKSGILMMMEPKNLTSKISIKKPKT